MLLFDSLLSFPKVVNKGLRLLELGELFQVPMHVEVLGCLPDELTLILLGDLKLTIMVCVIIVSLNRQNLA